MDDYEIVLCNKTERVCIFKLPPLSTSKGHYFDDWKEMIWEGGLRLIEKKKVLTLTFIDKQGKVFATTQLPPNPEDAIVKTVDSCRGYAVRLEKPNNGGFLWVGVVFRDRNDAFDFGVAFRDYTDKKNLNAEVLKEQFANQMDFSVKKGEKIKIDFGKNDSKPKGKGNEAADFFGFQQPKEATSAVKKNDGFDLFQFPSGSQSTTNQPVSQPATKPPATTGKSANWFDFDEAPKPPAKKQEVNLLDL